MNSLNLKIKNQESSNNKYSKKQIKLHSPDMKKLQAVHIDSKTTIFIAPGENPEEARSRYLSRFEKNN